MDSCREKEFLTAVIPVLHPEAHLSGLIFMQDESNKLGIRTIFVIDNFGKFSPEDREAVIKLKSNSGMFSKVLEGTYGDPGSARNSSLSQIKSPWITFWDSDDVPNPTEYLESVKKFSSADLIIGGYEEYDGLASTQIFTQNLFDLAFSPGIWRIVFKSQLFQDKRFPNLTMAEDQILLANLDLERKKIEYVSRIFYRYHTNVEGQLTKSKDALMDLGKALDMSRFQVSQSPTEFYKRVLAVRLLLTYLKQRNIRTISKFLMLTRYFSFKYLTTLIAVLIRRTRSNG